jgi:hypothetical protein
VPDRHDDVMKIRLPPAAHPSANMDAAVTASGAGTGPKQVPCWRLPSLGRAEGRFGSPPPAGSPPARSGRPGPTTYFDDRRAARRCVTTALCIQLPMFDTTVAVHTTANVWRLNGSNGDTAPGAAVACG